ncbi:hypothetical protein AVEN_217897-1 [Araneus ventricosus]|uniref:Uncharacterized protein n=1 Tax=Araneus ventricosus TaxID=182803 RepID=A0A4Y2EGR5_ARAVE|nr:hypothetical protein AVEN_217897-1 [Araneus ventricosus]
MDLAYPFCLVMKPPLPVSSYLGKQENTQSRRSFSEHRSRAPFLTNTLGPTCGVGEAVLSPQLTTCSETISFLCRPFLRFAPTRRLFPKIYDRHPSCCLAINLYSLPNDSLHFKDTPCGFGSEISLTGESS